MGSAAGNPPASTSPFGAGNGRPPDASGASFSVGGSAGNAPPASPSPPDPRDVAPDSESQSGSKLGPPSLPSDTGAMNGSTNAQTAGRGQFNAPLSEVSAASLADSTWLRIALDPGRDGPLFANAGGPFVAIGNQVRHLTTGEIIGKTGIAYGVRPLRALSANGEYYAVGDTSGIDVHRTEDGKTLHQIRGKNFGVRLEFLAFGADDRLIAVTTNKGEHYVQSWNLTTGKLSKDVMLESFDRQATLSDNGKLLAVPFRNDGVLILSENAGSHDELGEFALSINPFDIQQQADALHEALTMPAEERKRRLDQIRAQVREHDISRWIESQLADLA